MREQHGFTYTQTGQGQRIQRQSRVTSQHQRAVRQPPASPHRAGHDAGIHPEDMPFQSERLNERYVDEELEEDDAYYSTRMPTSARRYIARPDEQMIGNRRFVIHHSPPPRQREEFSEERSYQKEQKRFHWLVFLGIAMFLMIAGWVAFGALGNWWQIKQDDWMYGQSPRTFQTNAVVGHNDSSTNPSHFIGLNLNGQIIIIELPGGNASKARSYTITTVQGNLGNPPVKIAFQDLNADGKLDMLITIGDPGTSYTVMLLNDGTQFVSKLSK
jgi:hypothetical protein